MDGANRHDMKMVEPTLESMVAERPVPRPGQPQHLCLDKGYDFAEVEQLAARYGYTAHIRSRGQEREEKTDPPRLPRPPLGGRAQP